MKRTLIAVFSVSLTAGTLCLGYLLLKNHQIKKFIEKWAQAAIKVNKPLDPELLKKELEQLNLPDIRLLNAYSDRLMQGATLEELAVFRQKINERRIKEKVGLQSLEEITAAIILPRMQTSTPKK